MHADQNFLPVTITMDPVREKALQDYRKKLLEHAEVEGRLKESNFKNLINNISNIFALSNKLLFRPSERSVEGSYKAIRQVGK